MRSEETEEKCRQNSNLLITYLFFTFVEAKCGAGTTQPSKTLNNFYFHRDKLKLHFTDVFPEEVGGGGHMSPLASLTTQLISDVVQN